MTASPMETDQELRTALKVFGHFFDVLGQPLSVINHTGSISITTRRMQRLMSASSTRF